MTENVKGIKEQPETIDLMFYWKIFIDYRKLISIVTILAFFVSIAISLMLPKIYRSKAMILPPQQEQGIFGAMFGQLGGISSVAGDVLGSRSQTELYVSILKCEALKDQIINRCDLMKVYNKKNRASVYNIMDKNVSITAGKKDGIISISVEDTDPKRAADIANIYIEELNALLVKMSSNTAFSNKSYLEQRLVNAKTDLARAEDAIKLFQNENKAIDINEQSKGSIKAVAELMAQSAVLEVQLASLKRQFTDNSQEVKTVMASIDNIKSQISKLEGKGRSSALPSLGSVPEIAQEYLRLMRKFKIQESLVEVLTKQFEMYKLSETKNFSGLQIIQKAQPPELKSKPKRLYIVLMSTFFAFVFSYITCCIIRSYKYILFR